MMSICYCSGGESCCIRGKLFGPPGPHKCMDCGIWWVGYEHRCSWRYDVKTTTTIIVDDAEPGWRDLDRTSVVRLESG